MSRPLESPLAPEQALLLHQRLLRHDLDVTDDLYSALAAWLCQRLRSRRDSRDPHLVEEAVSQTLLDFSKHPARFDPLQGSLDAFLLLCADRDLCNLLRRERRHDRRKESLDPVELEQSAGNSLEEDSPLEQLVEEEASHAFRQRLEQVTAEWTAPERAVLQLWLQGERQRLPFAQALGVADRPVEEQEHEVKRVKDRLKKRLAREGFPHE